MSKTHGLSHTAEYKIWRGMISRCEHTNSQSYKNYGGRGISVCPQWRNDFAAFFADMGPRPSKKHSIDRIDNDGNYEPGNCRWATQSEQMRNTRSNILVESKGKMVPLVAAVRPSMVYNTVYCRIRDGWPSDLALTRRSINGCRPYMGRSVRRIRREDLEAGKTYMGGARDSQRTILSIDEASDTVRWVEHHRKYTRPRCRTGPGPRQTSRDGFVHWARAEVLDPTPQSGNG